MSAPAHVPSTSAAHHDPSNKVSTVNLSEIIEAHPCASVVSALEECMGEHDRDWTKCQREVTALRKCNQRADTEKK